MTDGQPSEGSRKPLPAAARDSRIHSFVSSVSQLSSVYCFKHVMGILEWELSLEKRGIKKERERMKKLCCSFEVEKGALILHLCSRSVSAFVQKIMII